MNGARRQADRAGGPTDPNPQAVSAKGAHPSRGEPFKVLSLFAGIGGFDLGLERTGGFRTVAFCEIEPFPQSILRKHWPEVPIYNDVRELTAARLASDGIAIDVICGGFPCQDISLAGKRVGIGEGTRSGLWSEMFRLVCEIRPRFLIVENVSNLLRGPIERPGAWFGRVLGDLAGIGYDAEWENIPAVTLGAPHRRERVWLVAHPHQDCDSHDRLSPYGIPHEENIWQRDRRLGELGASPRLCGRDAYDRIRRVVHGLPGWVDRTGALGNAVVPQIPELIGHAILASCDGRRMAETNEDLARGEVRPARSSEAVDAQRRAA